MSVLSTLRSQSCRASLPKPTSPNSPEEISFSSHGIHIPESSNILAFSSPQEAIKPLSLAPPFTTETVPTHNQCDLCPDAPASFGYGGAPTDGESSWYCSECGDGPYGSWQNCCQKCQHAKCGKCVTEGV